jgi:hypothetical protein
MRLEVRFFCTPLYIVIDVFGMVYVPADLSRPAPVWLPLVSARRNRAN